MIDQNNLFSLVLMAFVVWRLSQMLLGKVAPNRARELVEQGAFLLDVRTAGEFSGGHLPGAVNIPVHNLADRLSELPAKERPIVVYCASGMRSGNATSYLRKQGYTQVFDLGAMARWPAKA